MTLTFSPRVIRFTNAAWPELAQLGGLGGVRVRVVRFQPWLSPVAAMAWRGEVLVRRGWIAPCLHDLGPGNEIPDKHIWAISLLAWHEPHHLAERFVAVGTVGIAHVAAHLHHVETAVLVPVHGDGRLYQRLGRDQFHDQIIHFRCRQMRGHDIPTRPTIAGIEPEDLPAPR